MKAAELDALLWLSAGEPLSRRGEAIDDEVLALTGSCAEVERDLREDEWEALELILSYWPSRRQDRDSRRRCGCDSALLRGADGDRLEPGRIARMSMGGWHSKENVGAGAKVGFYACPANRGRIVRLFWIPAPGVKPPQRLAVEVCPACAERHPVAAISWRKPTERDEGREPDLVVVGVTPDPADDSKRPLRKGRR